MKDESRSHPFRDSIMDAKTAQDIPATAQTRAPAYKLAFTGFKFGNGLAGLAGHLEHEWVILANLFLLLMGFAILSRHFEESRIPDEMPQLLPVKPAPALLAAPPLQKLPNLACRYVNDPMNPQPVVVLNEACASKIGRAHV